jgi:protein gp37
MEKQWAVDLRERCKEAGVTFFYKQSNGMFPGNDPYLEGEEYKAWPKEFALPTI